MERRLGRTKGSARGEDCAEGTLGVDSREGGEAGRWQSCIGGSLNLASPAVRRGYKVLFFDKVEGEPEGGRGLRRGGESGGGVESLTGGSVPGTVFKGTIDRRDLE